MDIIVLLKQVPATESFIEVAGDGVSINPEGLKYVINPYDELAVEEALQIRQAQGGTVTIVSMGPAKAAEAIRTALAMGADKGVLIDPGQTVCDGLATAKVLAAAVKQLPFDLIIAGHRAVDDDCYQVGPAVAELLDLPNASMVIGQEIADGQIRCTCTVDGGTVDLTAPLPMLMTTQRGLNEPRYASLPGIMKAKKKPIDTKTLADIGLDTAALEGPALKILALTPPPERKGGRMIEAETVQDQVAQLVAALAQEVKVI